MANAGKQRRCSALVGYSGILWSQILCKTFQRAYEPLMVVPKPVTKHCSPGKLTMV